LERQSNVPAVGYISTTGMNKKEMRTAGKTFRDRWINEDTNNLFF